MSDFNPTSVQGEACLIHAQPAEANGKQMRYLPKICLVLFLVSHIAGLVSCDGGWDLLGSQGEDSEVPRAQCDAPIGGRPLSESSVESQPGYDEELKSRDLDALPETLPIADLDISQRARIAYALEIHLNDLGDTLNRTALLAKGQIEQAVLASFTVNADGAVEFDFDFFRRGFHRFYACSRGLPLTLSGFESLYGPLESIPFEDQATSIPKQGPRRMRENHALSVYAAETLDADGAVRETEIILGSHRTDGALDFLVYDEMGHLMDRSEFATLTGGTVVSASPNACLSCHVNFTENTFDVLLPTDP